MKTPREILLGRHKAMDPKLDKIRQDVIAEFNNKESTTRSLSDRLVSLLHGFPNVLWRELILPSRRIWAGLAAVWILILAANFSIQDSAETKMAKSPSSSELIMAYRQQQQLMSELFGPNDSPPAESQKPHSPRPASERRARFLMT